jgi:hypothetical protein
MVKLATLPKQGLSISCGLALMGGAAFADDMTQAVRSPQTLYYSTSAPGPDAHGPAPAVIQLALAENGPRRPAGTPADTAEPPAPGAAPREESPRVATSTAPAAVNSRPRSGQPASSAHTDNGETELITEAKRSIAQCRVRYAQVRDYTCTFLKRERVDGELSDHHVMQMKMRTQPVSIYFKFQQPNPGREAIFVAGRHGNRVLAHDVGIGKVIAGTLQLDPRGSRAMEGQRHPITEAGIGHMIETVSMHWEKEMHADDTDVQIHPHARVGPRPTTMIESTHPVKSPKFLFYKVKVYIDHELGVPIRFEAYDWPHRPGETPELMEEYTYMNLRLNVGLNERDFDPSNRQYSFGRF